VAPASRHGFATSICRSFLQLPPYSCSRLVPKRREILELHASPPAPLFINFWAESAKLGISLALCASSGQEPLQPLNGHLMVLAGLYTAQNYIFVAVHRYLSSNQIFQVANLRILLIALGSRVLFKRRLSLLQYLGVVLLAAACSIRTARARAAARGGSRRRAAAHGGCSAASPAAADRPDRTA